MYCLKCGRETVENQVFCDHCLDGMSGYPVKPDTAISLPKRTQESAPKKQNSRKKGKAPEEQIVFLSRVIRRLLVVLLAMVLLLAIAAAALMRSYEDRPQRPEIGRNYGVDTTQGS